MVENESRWELALIRRSQLLEVLILAVCLVAFGFFLSGYVFTPAKNLFSFCALGVLGLIATGITSLYLSYKRRVKGS